ncbi:M23 family metallopeptidase [Calidithermus chliarophilus]|uniref:M23 family metallopeptidase n=1 Tax=Calidithermus chliarophilus TaxID=52023 RepID=UPI00068868E5|nr:M23 family metallopeptidase [Calidithermus chliarophilus]
MLNAAQAPVRLAGGLEVPAWALGLAGLALVATLTVPQSPLSLVRCRVKPSGKYFWPMNPIKPDDGSGRVIPDTKFLDPEYPTEYGLHTGVDLNGPVQPRFGADSDLGQPVHAITDGEVVFAGPAGGNDQSWGNLVVIWHPGPAVWTRSAHLRDVLVRKGQCVSAGQQIGTVGKGYNGRWPAHLHFDVFKKKPVAWDDWPMHRRQYLLDHYVDPMEFFRKVSPQFPPRWAGRK